MASKLFHISPHQAENLTEISLREAFQLLETQLRPPFSLKIPSPSEYLELNRAIVYGILTEPHFASVHITHLNAIVIDGYASALNLILKLVYESYSKLLEPVKLNLIWVTSKLVEVSAVGIDNLVVGLLRQIVGGDVSDGNLWLCMELLKLCLDKFEILSEEPLILTSALYTYLRLLADHCRLSGNQKLENLKKLEIDFCVRMLRKHFQICLRIGRDLVRLLQDLVYVPEFRAVWKDLLSNPLEFRTPEFSDISQLYCLRTSSRYFLLRISPEMETQLSFLLTYVRWGHQKRYQEWFARKFLCRDECDSVICDIVRFICCAHHPPNEIIQSDVISRWAVIGWLLKCCRKNYTEANTKLALFYDWLFFDERTDNVMNIEPGILLIMNSVPRYIDMTRTLIEFMILLMDNYDVQRKNLTVRGLSTAFRVLLKKGVVQSLDALTSSSLISPLLKQRLAFVVSDSNSEAILYCSLQPSSEPNPANVESETLLSGDSHLESCVQKPTAELPHCSLEPSKLPSPSSVETQTSIMIDSNLKDLVHKSTASAPCSSLQAVNLLSLSNLQAQISSSNAETEKSLPPEVRIYKRRRVTGDVNDALPLSDKSRTSLGSLVTAKINPLSIIEELLRSLGDCIKTSSMMGLQNLEKILFLYANLSSEVPDDAKTGDFDLTPQVVASRITEAFKSNGYEMFNPLKCPQELKYDDEINSATAVITSVFFFAQKKRIKEMILFWSRNGYLVGPRLLSYASRLFSEAHISCLRNLVREQSSVNMNSPETSLLKHHIDSYISFSKAEGIDPSSSKVSASKLDAKLVIDLVESTFASYRNFISLIDRSQGKEDSSLSKLLLSDVLSYSGWKTKRLTTVLCSMFACLSDLCTSKEEFVLFLLEKLDYVELVTIQFQICLRRFSVFGEDTKLISNLIKNSLSWEIVKQKKLWGLLTSELAGLKVQVEKVAADCLDVFDPSVHSVAVEGLFDLCCRLAPTTELVGTMISLRGNRFGDFAAAVLANWVVSNGSMLFNSIVICLEKLHNKDIHLMVSGSSVNKYTILELLNFLDKQEMKNLNFVNEMSGSISEVKARLMDMVIGQRDR
ncbi:uncharacterized protein LOC113309644 [Papaver somniferum]|uniref:uncharacterized protein LOC113309644 n=1 Tax=Papaver somniferum TaxID=3469 RepID=UPI000E705C6C|nr:uncharacterized protein LOC113309644 [Papaver somniferum]XP_026413886.1 uncharacterized protein LOC113309644 [Papaver somniferum]XP_026413888.1 uncharacterized protein LOC113309644 [Papaver somniferum]XP_026413889.1 uncharacterized protein LOC113309644 [Papaver somniferum]XP_026413890.1 uncharacterized protein LOC113309644 [Papaver somniferum]XP_026413891.1 uncharacterized protein LOC113309644 [Papaver somniferum]XP_026413892.1 uncharacterized protein LOC113309644 [Papaver somniferum]XP_0